MSAELFDAIDQHDAPRVTALLAQGADPNALLERPPHWRPLDAAIEELENGGPLEIIRLLIEHGADVKAWDEQHGDTPLHSAMLWNHQDAVRLLLEAGADPNVVSAQGDAPLRWAAEQGDVDMARLFLKHGADQTINDFGGSCGYTPLGLAAWKLNLPMLKLLLDAGADPDALDEDEHTAREHLPPRDQSDPEMRAEAMELLARPKP